MSASISRFLCVPGAALVATWALVAISRFVQPLALVAFLLTVAAWPFLVPASAVASFIGLFVARREKSRRDRVILFFAHTVLLSVAALSAWAAVRAVQSGILIPTH